MKRLHDLLTRIDKKGYKAYKALQGDYDFDAFRLHIDHVQGDPFADPSRCRLFVEAATAALPTDLYQKTIRRIALEDYIGRSIAHAIHQQVKGHRGSGRSGEFFIATSGQQVLERNAILVHDDGAIEVRFQIALPADGRTINGTQAKTMLLQELPRLVKDGILALKQEPAPLRHHVDTVEDQQALRDWLPENNLVAFVAEGAILARHSGIDDHPLKGAVTFQSPPSLRKSVALPNGGTITGMGIPKGITLIVGGGFHGKSTLLHAIERGVYNHIPGDGRERVATDPTAFKIRAEDGRSIHGVDISPFISNLPQGRDTIRFSSQNASGSTSQAANIMEALECGSTALLIDEDTSATNFMIRDERMQALVTQEPITPLVQRVRDLYTQNGVSVVMVMGGSGDFFGTADTVILMDNYRPADVTAQARKLAPAIRPTQGLPPIKQQMPRVADPHSLLPQEKNGKVRIQAFATRALRYGREEIDLGRIEQLVDSGQLLAIGYLLKRYAESKSTDDIGTATQQLMDWCDQNGMDGLTPYITGILARPRPQELAAAINRLRALKIVDEKPT